MTFFYPVVYIEATHIKIRRGTVQGEDFYVLPGLKQDFTREVLGIINIPSESATGWSDVLASIKQIGLDVVGLFVTDDLTSL